MTEAEWLTCPDPEVMLKFLPGRPNERKLRLFACACARRVWSFMTERCSRDAVIAAEQFADGLGDRHTLDNARKAIRADFRNRQRCKVRQRAWIETANAERAEARAASWAGAWDTARETLRADAHAAACRTAYAAAITYSSVWGKKANRVEEAARQVSILRDMFDNPFRTISVNSLWLGWNDNTVPRLAQAIYEQRAFDRLPILADALEEAGCTNADILNHCRQPGEHVRGCWVVDLMLGKS